MKCPKCLGKLDYKESSFEQYQPSVYYCSACDAEFNVQYIKGFNEGILKEI